MTPPTAPGYGLVLIERVRTRDLGGSLALDYTPAGLNSVLAFSLAQPAQPDPAAV